MGPRASPTYALERRQFGGPIADFQGLRFLLAEMATQVEAARALTYRASGEFSLTKPALRGKAAASNQMLLQILSKLGRRWAMGLATVALALLGDSARGGEAEAGNALIERGWYVFATAGGCACHTPPGAPGLNAGGQKFERPFGVVYSPNITPDLDTGIGRWTDAQIVNAIRRGERPDGTRLVPIHPYMYFAHIADDEAFALAAYLKSAKPISHKGLAPALKGPVSAISVPAGPKAAPRGGPARGEYLVKGPAHCGNCHTPRRPDGTQDLSRFLAGGPGPEGAQVPNITPHPSTGIGRWTEEQIARFLTTGVKPNGQSATSLMRVVIQGTSGGYKDMTPADAPAIAHYLKTVPAIHNKVP